MQATCDANELFTSVDISWPRSVHDSRVLRNSKVYTAMMNAYGDALLLGDDGYPLPPWLMTPFRNPQTEAETNYNKIFTKERCIIERCFGQLKQKFTILQYKIRIGADLVAMVIASCFVLHNIAKFLKDEYIYEKENNASTDFRNMEMDKIAETSLRSSDAGKRRDMRLLTY